MTLEEFIARLEGSEKKQEADLAKMFPPERIEQIKRRELKKYREMQDEKWRRWFEAVSK